MFSWPLHLKDEPAAQFIRIAYKIFYKMWENNKVQKASIQSLDDFVGVGEDALAQIQFDWMVLYDSTGIGFK